MQELTLEKVLEARQPLPGVDPDDLPKEKKQVVVESRSGELIVKELGAGVLYTLTAEVDGERRPVLDSRGEPYQYVRDEHLWLNYPLWRDLHGRPPIPKRTGRNRPPEPESIFVRHHQTAVSESWRQVWKVEEGDLLSLIEGHGIEIAVMQLLVQAFPDTDLAPREGPVKVVARKKQRAPKKGRRQRRRRKEAAQ